ncbi:MutS-related protein [Candidatus Enterococcus clewellii]|uniref:DNA mismatch repair proteins mutS family domain-containing protein n=1 Tax=Candidatus Enterococcus clewellii TaxID=1834193 RepID=A0A242K3K8_9ENTE|nr:hypothetical protein [Enterococcus sp. 9E7_DIV0242]OTP13589.1 hypothetical protein A5888_003067 [Enterococcus sp. 9E7_DIV0242]
MDQTVWLVIGLICLVLLVIWAIDIYSGYKLKQRIRFEWGRRPAWQRLDKEESLKQAWKYAQTYQKFDSEIDDVTWYDLDMMEVFEAVNATYSSVGSEALYQQMRNFDFNSQEAEQLEELLHFYQENPEQREEIQFRFAQLGKKDDNFVKHYLSTTNGKELSGFYLHVLLGLLPVIGLLLLAFGLVGGAILTLVSICFNVIYYLRKKELLETELNSMRYFVQTLATAKAIGKVKSPVQSELQKHLAPLKNILHFGASFRVKSNSEAEVMFDYLNMALMIPFISYNFVLKRLGQYHEQAVALWDILGRLEAAYAILNFRSYMPQVAIPIFEAGGVVAAASYHPLLDEAAVVNPINWQKNTLVTGSNASGKSTYVKSIAINCILAQTIHTTAAETFMMERGHVLTSMAVEDDLFEGDSYFVAEIKSIKRVMEQIKLNERCYCFIDEILKGTNTIERISASASIVNWMKTYPSLAFVATHDIELTEILKHSCENVHFEERVEEDGIRFDYELKPGKARTRNALQLLKIMDYPEEVVSNAKKEAAFFDEHRSWNVIE